VIWTREDHAAYVCGKFVILKRKGAKGESGNSWPWWVYCLGRPTHQRFRTLREAKAHCERMAYSGLGNC